MAVIDIGTRDISDNANSAGSYTLLNADNPANDTGTLDTIKVKIGVDATGCKAGTFYGSAASWTPRDSAAIGSVTSGSEQTFSGLSIDVETSDIIGWYGVGGAGSGLRVKASGTRKYKSGDQFAAGTQTYTADSYAQWLYGTGTTSSAGSPDAPTTPYPVTTGTGDGEDQTLTCYVSDPNSLPMDVTFYDASDDSVIGVDSDVASGGTATILWEGLTPSTLYTWYAIADNGSGTAQSADWTFTAGTRSWEWYVSSDNTLRRYVDGVKVEQATDALKTFEKPVLALDKIKLTQTDGNEYIDSLADGYVDVGATTGIRFSVNSVKSLDLETDGVISTDTVNYETLVTDDDDIPNKKYVDDEVLWETDGTSGYVELKTADDVNITEDKKLLFRSSGDADYYEFLCHCNGVDTETTFTDETGLTTITVNGSAQTDTAQKKFGTASLLCEGSADYLALSANTDLNFGLEDFTIDCWVRGGTQGVAYPIIITSNSGDTYGTGSIFYSDGASGGVFSFTIGSTRLIVSDTTLSANTWYHVALTRSSGTFYLFLDGVLKGSNASYTSTNCDFSSTTIGYATYSPTNTSFTGNIDEVRIMKGYCAWTTNFTPPVAEYELPSGLEESYLTYATDTSDVKLFVDNVEVMSATNSDITFSKNAIFSGSITRNTTTVNAATYDLATTDDILNVTYTTTGAVTSLTLPTAQCVDGRVIVIKDAGGNASTYNITIDTEGTEKIDGGDTFIINGDYDSITLYSDGSNWFVI
jgi:hypothetical protein